MRASATNHATMKEYDVVCIVMACALAVSECQPQFIVRCRSDLHAFLLHVCSPACSFLASSSSNLQRPAITPAALKAALGRRSQRWRGMAQQDAHEFMCAVLDTVQEEVLAAEVR